VVIPRASVLALGAACAGAPRPPDPIHNTAPATAPARATLTRRCPEPPAPRVAPPGPARGAIAGIVIDEDCEPVPGASVIARIGPVNGDAMDVTDEHGRFTITDLAPGQYAITVYYLDAQLERGGVGVRAGAIERVQLAMPPPTSGAPLLTRDPATPTP
jgi:hypothetical protein